MLLKWFAAVLLEAAFKTGELPVTVPVVETDDVVGVVGVVVEDNVVGGKPVAAEVETPTVSAIGTPPRSQHVLFPQPQQKLPSLHCLTGTLFCA